MTPKVEFQKIFDSYVHCYREKDADRCASFFAPDGELLSPFGPPAVGREAIQAAHIEWFAEAAEAKQLNIIAAGVEGALGWCLARYSEGTEAGTSLNVLERQPGGSWLIRCCSLNEEPVQGTQ